jgi:hypothetical protein
MPNTAKNKSSSNASGTSKPLTWRTSERSHLASRTKSAASQRNQTPPRPFAKIYPLWTPRGAAISPA